MNVRLEHTSFNELKLEGIGIDLSFKPAVLYKQMLSKESQSCLDEALEEAFKKALTEFYDSEEYNQRNSEITTREILSEHVKKIAHLERILYDLHSDSECIELSSEHKYIRDFCFTVWKYATEYGFRSSKNVTLER